MSAETLKLFIKMWNENYYIRYLKFTQKKEGSDEQ